jgi:hypothetical protein
MFVQIEKLRESHCYCIPDFNKMTLSTIQPSGSLLSDIFLSLKIPEKPFKSQVSLKSLGSERNLAVPEAVKEGQKMPYSAFTAVNPEEVS